MIDGAKALRAAINKVFGAQHPVQRCRNHKIRNVCDRLPEEQKDQVKAAMRASYKLEAKEGMARLRKLADWLEQECPAAANSLSWKSAQMSNVWVTLLHREFGFMVKILKFFQTHSPRVAE